MLREISLGSLEELGHIAGPHIKEQRIRGDSGERSSSAHPHISEEIPTLELRGKQDRSVGKREEGKKGITLQRPERGTIPRLVVSREYTCESGEVEQESLQ
ncbi:hypothetical protein NQZ68_010215 [Dissostichus eleginoides]|nr:hypothetical protein NQZ68_010215 [Dissostichus eleginoides]